MNKKYMCWLGLFGFIVNILLVIYMMLHPVNYPSPCTAMFSFSAGVFFMIAVSAYADILNIKQN